MKILTKIWIFHLQISQPLVILVSDVLELNLLVRSCSFIWFHIHQISFKIMSITIEIQTTHAISFTNLEFSTLELLIFDVVSPNTLYKEYLSKVCEKHKKFWWISKFAKIFNNQTLWTELIKLFLPRTQFLHILWDSIRSAWLASWWTFGYTRVVCVDK